MNPKITATRVRNFAAIPLKPGMAGMLVGKSIVFIGILRFATVPSPTPFVHLYYVLPACGPFICVLCAKPPTGSWFYNFRRTPFPQFCNNTTTGCGSLPLTTCFTRNTIAHLGSTLILPPGTHPA
jgi:hypothetical protein